MQLSSSYPFKSLAEYYEIPYGQVLLYADFRDPRCPENKSVHALRAYVSVCKTFQMEGARGSVRQETFESQVTKLLDDYINAGKS